LVEKIIFEVLNMKQKRKIVKRSLKMYHKSSKKEKGKILTELSRITGYNRKYLTYLLNIARKRIKMKKGKVILKPELLKLETHKRGRKKKYPERLIKYLLKIWKLSSLISSKHLWYFIKENSEWIFEEEYFGKIPREDKRLILEMSPATIERLLSEKKREQ